MPAKKSKIITPKIKFIILNFGHVEDSHPYSWIFENKGGYNFQNKFDAVFSLAEDFYSAYIEQHPLDKLNKCCIIGKKEEDTYCKVCGHYLSANIYFAGSYKSWLVEHSERNMDESEVVNYFNSCNNWNPLNPPYGLTKENSLYIGSAEKILTGLLYNTGMDDHIDEDIASEIFSNTTFEKFKASFENEDGPSIYK